MISKADSSSKQKETIFLLETILRFSQRVDIVGLRRVRRILGVGGGSWIGENKEGGEEREVVGKDRAQETWT